MARTGPKPKFNEKLAELFIRLSKDGKTVEQIADVTGVTSRTLRLWMAKNPDLFHAVKEARQVADELVEAALFSRATGYSHPETKAFCYEGCIVTEDLEKHYPPDTQAAMFWLRNRQPERWKEKTEGDVNVSQSVSVNTMTDEQLDAKIAGLISKGNK